MGTKSWRAGSIGGAGVLLLIVAGCSADATSEERAELGTETQPDESCFSWCDQRWMINSLSCEMPDTRSYNYWCMRQADEEYFQCLNSCWEAEWAEQPPPDPPELPPNPNPPTNPPGTPPTCPGPNGPPSPTTPEQSGCDYDWQDWCYEVCDLCAWYPDKPACRDNCDRVHCASGAEPEEPSCRAMASGNCAAMCDWVPTFDDCYEGCLFQNCGNDD